MRFDDNRGSCTQDCRNYVFPLVLGRAPKAIASVVWPIHIRYRLVLWRHLQCVDPGGVNLFCRHNLICRGLAFSIVLIFTKSRDGINASQRVWRSFSTKGSGHQTEGPADLEYQSSSSGTHILSIFVARFSHVFQKRLPARQSSRNIHIL